MALRERRHWGTAWLLVVGFAVATGSCRDIWGIDGFEGATSGGQSSGGQSSGGAVVGVTAACPKPCFRESSKLFACLPGSSNKRLCTGDTPHCDPESGTCVKLLMDETEVTEADYERFEQDLARGLGVRPEYAPRCRGFGGSGPSEGVCEPLCVDGCEDHPKTCVSWCEAWAYCLSRDAYLCGSLIGAEVDGDGNIEQPSYDSTAESDAWVNACSVGGTEIEETSRECARAGIPMTYPVREERPGGCEQRPRGYDQFLGLRGNVREWVNNCNGQNQCAARGASVQEGNWDVRCDAVAYHDRDARRNDIGFRCCGGPPEGGAGGESSSR